MTNKDIEFSAFEAKLREQIAKEIEAWEIIEDTTKTNPDTFNFIKQHFAGIARGNK